MLVIKKKLTGNFDYDDGLVFKFEAAQPRHLQFYCKTTHDPTLSESESCNLRLYKSATKEMISLNLGQETVIQASDANVGEETTSDESNEIVGADEAEAPTGNEES